MGYAIYYVALFAIWLVAQWWLHREHKRKVDAMWADHHAKLDAIYAKYYPNAFSETPIALRSNPV